MVSVMQSIFKGAAQVQNALNLLFSDRKVAEIKGNLCAKKVPALVSKIHVIFFQQN